MTKYSLILVAGLLISCNSAKPLPIGAYCVNGNPNAKVDTRGKVHRLMAEPTESVYTVFGGHVWLQQRLLKDCPEEQSHD